MTNRVSIFRQSYGPHTSTAGAVWSLDILRCRCGQLQKPWSRHPDDASDLCLACGSLAFANPSPAGYYYREGTWLTVTARRLTIHCRTCGAGPGQPCMAVGRVGLAGNTMKTVHVARRRATGG